MLNAVDVIQEVSHHCDYLCQAAKAIPRETLQFTTETKPTSAGSFFNADVLVELGQNVLILCDSYTDAILIQNKQTPTLRNNLIILIWKLRSNIPITIHVYPQSSLKVLQTDRLLADNEFALR